MTGLARPWPPLSALYRWYHFRPEPTTFGTYCAPTTIISFDDPEVIAAEERRKVLAVLREAMPAGTGPTLAGKPCPACAFRSNPRPQLPHFPLPPFEPYEPQGERLPYRLEFYGADPMAYLRVRLSSVI